MINSKTARQYMRNENRDFKICTLNVHIKNDKFNKYDII